MTAIDDGTAQATFVDSPSVGSVLTSPREFTRETLAGVVTALAELVPRKGGRRVWQPLLGAARPRRRG